MHAVVKLEQLDELRVAPVRAAVMIERQPVQLMLAALGHPAHGYHVAEREVQLVQVASAALPVQVQEAAQPPHVVLQVVQQTVWQQWTRCSQMHPQRVQVR